MITPLTLNDSSSPANDFQDVVKTIYQDLHLLISLSGQNTVESTHQLRKKLKLFRSFLKLIQPCSGDHNAYKQANRTVRDWGRKFSDLRDAHVRNLMLEEMAQDSFFRSFLETINELHQVNQKVVDSIENKLLKDELAFVKLDQSIKADKSIASYLNSACLDKTCLLAGIAHSYEKAYNAYHFSSLHPSADTLHDWRKCVKDQQYQFGFMLNHLPSGYIAIHNEINQLSDLLGKDQDLINFINWIHETPGLSAVGDCSGLTSLLKSRRNRLRSSLEHLGKTLYLEAPVPFKEKLYNHSGL
ncbi:MAG: CHAD domain-containing protein [Balneolaceae bacterium]|nr:MAG: CHAD domain-containing protein [Balneolaceae bacterium]